MYLYAIVQQGVYMQDVYGIFDKQENAEFEARLLAGLEPDKYHSFQVIKFELNKLSEYDTDNFPTRPSVIDPNIVFITK